MPGERLVYAERKLSEGMMTRNQQKVAYPARQAHAVGLVFLSQVRSRDGGPTLYTATRISEATAEVLGLGWDRKASLSAALLPSRRPWRAGEMV